MSTTLPDMICVVCGKTPSELPEFSSALTGEDMTNDEFCWREEGTLNTQNGHFVCMADYIKIGMPSSPTGWTAP